MGIGPRSRSGFTWICILSILCSIAFLYLPYSGSHPVFDDYNIIGNGAAYDYAVEPFSRYTRALPYFTIGFLHVVSGGSLIWNRYFSMLLHVLVVVALYFFLDRATNRPVGEDATRRRVVFVVCVGMAISPVAVYAAGYLIQRTIVMATLFSILSANLYLRAQQQRRNADLLSSALFAGLSMMCKEHAVLLPFAVVALTPLVADWDRLVVRRAFIFLGLSLPTIVWAVLNRGVDVVGTSYEIYSGAMTAQLVSQGGVDFPGGLWVMSAATQVLLFWKYLFLWLVPNPEWMSADMRVDFSMLWSSWLAYAALFASLGVLLATVLYGWRSRGKNRLGQFSSVLLFAAIPFAVELSVVRVQEPFVLYRSYLWMPAYALILCLVVAWGDLWLGRFGVLPRRAYWGVLLVACVALYPMAQNRLQSLSSEEVLWQDAMIKLPRPDVAGADRIYYNLAGEAFKRKNYSEALRLSEMVVSQNPGSFQGYLAKGMSLLSLRRFDEAMHSFDDAESHHPPRNFLGYIEFKRCSVIAANGSRDDTIACLRRSAKLGYEMARFRLKMAGVSE